MLKAHPQAPASWVIDLAAQVYGMTSTPSMLDVNNKYITYFSPQPFFVAAFFTTQQVIQALWLYRLLTVDNDNGDDNGDDDDDNGNRNTPRASAELATQMDYAPVSVLGNVCMAAWMLLWKQECMWGSAAAVWVNSMAQLAYITGVVGNLKQRPLNTHSSRSSLLTHLNAKTFAGISVLDLLHNTSAAGAPGQRAGTLVKLLTGVGFGAACLLLPAADWIFGAGLVFDLVALSVGQMHRDPGWSKLLAAYAVGSAVVVGVKNWVRPPYTSEPDDYENLAYGDSEVRY